MLKTRAAVLEEFGQPLQVQELDLAGPQAGEVLVKIQACGVCHTDLYTASGADPSGYAPCVLGHEGAGEVIEVGEGVKIKDGPFEDFDGVVEEIMPDKGRIRVTVNIFGRAAPVELEYWQAEKL